MTEDIPYTMSINKKLQELCISLSAYFCNTSWSNQLLNLQLVV